MTASEVKSHSSMDRFLVVFHSPTGRTGNRTATLLIREKGALCDLFGLASAFSAVRFEQRKPPIGRDFARSSANNSRIYLHFRLYGGEGGIRTLDRVVRPYNGLANRRLQPLGHLSGVAGIIVYHS